MNDIQFVVVDAKDISTDLIAGFETVLGETLYPGDIRHVFLDQETQVIVALKNDINEIGKQNLLRYAKGDNLDALGERTDTPRLQAQSAQVTIQFTLSGAQTVNITIPQGTRVTPDGQLYFATVNPIIINAGQQTGSVTAIAIEAGSKYNNFASGQIKTLVDLIPYVGSVVNTNTSFGGSDIEDDDSYRERVRESPSKFSTAGPDDAYVFWAKTADVNISDVAVMSPTPGQVKIIVLMNGGTLPSQTVLNEVLAICSDRTRRPLTDQVIVAAPTVVSYNINITYYISKTNASNEVNIRNAVELSGGIMDQYKLWQSSILGRAINPDYLRQLMLDAGVYKIDVTSPVYTDLTVDKVAQIGTVTVNYGGLK